MKPDENAPREQASITSRNLRALLIEDTENDALLLIDHLQSAGFNVSWRRVENEAALLAELAQHWDIIFSDYSMPRFNGKRALEIVRKSDPDIPFIFVSGTIGEDVAVEGMKAGAQDYVMKGHFTRLVPAILRELAEAQLRRERRDSAQALRKLSLAVEQAAESICITDVSGKIEYVNPSFERLTGYAAAELLGKSADQLRSDLYDDNYYRHLQESLKAGHPYQDVMLNRRKSGEIYFEEKVISPLKDDLQRITHFVYTGRDITGRIKSDRARAQLITILDAASDIIAIMDSAGNLQYLNNAGFRQLDMQPPASIAELDISDLMPEWAATKLLNEAIPEAASQGNWKGEVALKRGYNDEIPVSCVLVAHKNESGNIQHYSTIMRDITELRLFEQELQKQATHDALTGLPNRVMLQNHLDMEISRSIRDATSIAVCFLDLDNFKRINDSLGHAAGDDLLCQVAERLQNCLRPSDLIARYGGDEFTIVSGGLSSTDDIFIIANKLFEAISFPFSLPGQEVFVALSMGISVYPGNGSNTEVLLKNADTAMYRAKKNGRNHFQFYNPEMNARGQELLAMETDLRRALARREFCLFLQPQMSLHDNRIAGFETLIRWNHPERGMIAPADFIPMLEDTGLILPVGNWVLQDACRQFHKLRESTHPPDRLSVNVSARQFNDLEFVNMVRDILREYDIPPSHLELEITESTLMQDVKIVETILKSLHKLGVRLAIDDFGTGYSSLAYLKRFPLDVLKIDQMFIRDVESDADVRAIVEASISLGHKLGLEVVAEGVETAEQLAFLRAHECDLIQGYFLSKPMPEDSIRQFCETFKLTREQRSA